MVETVRSKASSAAETAKNTARDVGRNAVAEATRRAEAAERQADQSLGQADETAARQVQDARDSYTEAGARLASGDLGGAAREVGGLAARSGDRLAGRTDEEVNQNVKAYDAGLDVLAGSTDEAVGRAVAAGKRGDVAGVADHLAGSTDEGVARAAAAAGASDAAGAADHLGGGLDEATHGVVQASAPWADALAGNTDEAVGRAVADAQAGDYAGAGDHLAGQLDESVGSMGAAADAQVQDAKQIYSNAGQELASGDLGGAAETMMEGAARSGDRLAGRTDEATDRMVKGFMGTETAVEYAALLGDEAVGHLDEQFAGGFQKSATDAATQSGGFLTESQEADLASAAGEFSADVTATSEMAGGAVDYIDPGEGQGVAGDFTRGVTNILGVGNVFAGAGAAETGAEIGANAPDQFDETGGMGLAASGAAIGGMAAHGMYDQATSNPAKFAGESVGELLLGGGVGKIAEKAADAGRSAKVASKADETYSINDVSTDEAASGDLPNFETDPGAPTSKAVKEIEQKADESTPEAVRESLDDKPALYHGTGDGGLGADVEVGEGGSELPGLWASPQVSPLRLGDSGSSMGIPTSLSDLRPRLPNVRGSGDQIVAAPGDRVEAMPDMADEFGRVKNADGEWTPDPSTSGYKYLDEQATPGTAQVRPPGSRTTELEAIYPPGSKFVETGDTFGVKYGGRTIEMNTYKRVDQQEIEAQTGETGQEAIDAYQDQTGKTVTDTPPSSSVDDRSGTPFVPTPMIGGTPPVATEQVAPPSQGDPEVYEYTTGPEDAGAPPDGPSNYNDPYNGGSVFQEPGADHILDVDISNVDSDGGLDDTFTPGPTSPGPTSPGPTSPTPTSTFGGSYGTPFDEYGTPTGPGGSGGGPPSSPPGGPAETPGSPPGSGGPPSFWPPWGPPTTSGGSGDSRRPPGSPFGYGSSAGGFYDPFSPGQGASSELSADEPRKKKDEREGPLPYQVGFTNPIASGAQVLFGAQGALMGGAVSFDETGMAPAPSSDDAPKRSEDSDSSPMNLIDETGGLGY